MAPSTKDRLWRQHSELNAVADLSPELEAELDRLDEEFWVSGDKLKQIVNRFREELDEGLQENGKNIPMNMTWVHSLPSGDEKGTFLTLDLGGTNLRVCKVDLHGKEGKEKHTLLQEQYKLPDQIKSSNADELWKHVAEKLETFLKDTGLDKEYNAQNKMPFGFTFSYPATQERIDHGILQTWTKGFDIKGVEGEDVAKQLRDAMQQRNLPIELICVINDTVGAMIASAYNDPSTIIGAIFGTGCNAAFMSSLSSIRKLSKDDPRLKAENMTNGNASAQNDMSKRKMAINCEYGAFDNERRVLPITEIDKQVDAESPRPGEQAFEKLSAGLYLGEIYRLITLELSDRGLVFSKQVPAKLRQPYAIDTGFLSQIEDDESPQYSKSRELFRDVLGIEVRDQDLEFSRRLAEIIAVRGARLCACGIAAICTKENVETGHVAADGSVANKHPKFKRRWAKALGEVLDWEEGVVGEEGGPISITSAEDGSGVGCAIIAAMEMERRAR